MIYIWVFWSRDFGSPNFRIWQTATTLLSYITYTLTSRAVVYFGYQTRIIHRRVPTFRYYLDMHVVIIVFATNQQWLNNVYVYRYIVFNTRYVLFCIRELTDYMYCSFSVHVCLCYGTWTYMLLWTHWLRSDLHSNQTLTRTNHIHRSIHDFPRRKESHHMDSHANIPCP